MANFLQNFYLPRDPLNVLLVVDFFFLKDFDGDLYQNKFITHMSAVKLNSKIRQTLKTASQSETPSSETYFLSSQNVRPLLHLSERSLAQRLACKVMSGQVRRNRS